MRCRIHDRSGDPASGSPHRAIVRRVHETTVRFSDELWARVRDASKREGASAAQFVRDATVARIAVDEGVRTLRHDVDAALRRLDERVQAIEHVLRRHGLR